MDSVWFQIIVIMLSTVLLIFLILAILVTIKLVKIANSIKKITSYAENVADRADHVSSFFAKTATPIAIAKLVSNLSEAFNNRSKKSKKGKE